MIIEFPERKAPHEHFSGQELFEVKAGKLFQNIINKKKRKKKTPKNK